MRVDPRERQNAGIELLEIAEVYKQYRHELTDKAAFIVSLYWLGVLLPFWRKTSSEVKGLYQT